MSRFCDNGKSEKEAMMKDRGRPFRIAVSVEHSRGWGRRVCEGVCSYAQTHPDWRITMFDGVLPSVGDLKAFDGFLWSVSDARTAERLDRSRAAAAWRACGRTTSGSTRTARRSWTA